MGLGLGWLRAAAQGYTYSYNKIHLKSYFQNNLSSWILKLGWGLDGYARWREVLVTATVKLYCEVIFKRI